AMSLGKPVIVTSGALEGIMAQPGRHVVLADDEAAFASACCRLATTDEGAAIGRAARELVVTSYDWSARLSLFDDVLRPDNKQFDKTRQPIVATS
ncbi:MAG TPA: glycosyltransferase, partial [Acetobacteraceae bacterium]